MANCVGAFSFITRTIVPSLRNGTDRQQASHIDRMILARDLGKFLRTLALLERLKIKHVTAEQKTAYDTIANRSHADG